MNADFDSLAGDLRDQIVLALGGLVQAAAEDLRTYAHRISINMVEAMSTVPDETRRQAVLVELGAQVRAVAEINRIRASATQWAITEKVIAAIFNAAMAGLVRSLPEQPQN